MVKSPLRYRRIALDPAEVRKTRELLGLTQREAGELLGGGPNAFAKYEAGTVKPSAAVVSLLRVLQANPSGVHALRQHPTDLAPSSLPLPLAVTAEQIGALGGANLPDLLRLTLSAEALAHGLPADGIHVASGTDTADGGEDGRIEWKGGQDRTPFLPSSLCQFQLKAGPISPAQAGREVLTRDGEVKEMVRPVLENGGHYIVLCAQPYTKKQVEAREDRLRETLRSKDIELDDGQVVFRDADQMAMWVNHHPAVASWVLERTTAGLPGPLRSWRHWSRRAEHFQSPWVADERLPQLRSFLRERAAIAEPQHVARLVGLAGIGKSRLALEAFRSADQEDATGAALSSLVLYADEHEADPRNIRAAVQDLADSSARAIVVVDSCSPETHGILAGTVLGGGSNLSLLTIDDEVPTGTLDSRTMRLPEAPSEVTDSIIERALPGLQSEDQRRLARFSKGYPRIAIRVAQAWMQSTPLAHATDDHLVDAFILGRSPGEPDVLRKSAALLATFGLVTIEQPNGWLSDIARLGRGVSEADLYANAKNLAARGIGRQRGRYFSIEPRPIALKLAERQWTEWTRDQWDAVLTGTGNSTAGLMNKSLNVEAAKQLALLNTVGVSKAVAEHVCRFGGPFDEAGLMPGSGNTEVLSLLAEIDVATVIAQLERSLVDVQDLESVRDDERRHLVWALEKVAFDATTFEEGARWLLRLAAAENETWANNATGQFVALFPLFLGNTEADSSARLSFLDEVLSSKEHADIRLGIRALDGALELDHFMRTAGAETHGTRPALESWRPATNREATEYLAGCVQRLSTLATSDDELLALAHDSLGRRLADLIRHGFIDIAETAVEAISPRAGHWPVALNGLQFLIEHFATGLNPPTIDRVRGLIDKLQPQSLETRTRYLVTDMPWDYLGGKDVGYDEQLQRQQEAVRVLAAELTGEPQTLRSLLPQLSQGQQRMTHVLGQAIGELSDPWEYWLEPILQAVADAPEEARHFGLLVGYIGSIAKDKPTVVEALKRQSAVSPIFAPALPLMCSTAPTPSGIATTDIALLVAALEGGFLPPRWIRWDTVGRGLRDSPPAVAAPLFDAMLDHSAQGFESALDLIGLYIHDEPERLEGLRPQVRKIAENATRWKWGEQMALYHFEQIMTWMLEKGRQDRDASATALALAKAVVDVEDYDQTHPLKPVIPPLLAELPEVSWPLIGQTIVNADPLQSFLLESMLGEWRFGQRRDSFPILSLPVDTLFAWCHAYPDQAPAFAAKIVPVFGDSESDPTVHPVLVRLIEEFGDREDVDSAIVGNMHTGGWAGPEEGYWTPYQEPVGKLLNHPSPKVRKWAKDTLRWLAKTIDAARTRDAEEEALFGE